MQGVWGLLASVPTLAFGGQAAAPECAHRSSQLARRSQFVATATTSNKKHFFLHFFHKKYKNMWEIKKMLKTLQTALIQDDMT